MKKWICVFLIFITVLSGCSRKADTNLSWQEQYDLGIRYLSEGNYEEAIIAFTIAIEIDPKQLDGYISLIQTYADIGDSKKIVEVLKSAVEAIGSGENCRAELRADGTYLFWKHNEGVTQEVFYDELGNILEERFYYYDSSGNRYKFVINDYNLPYGWEKDEMFYENGQMVKEQRYWYESPDDSILKEYAETVVEYTGSSAKIIFGITVYFDTFVDYMEATLLHEMAASDNSVAVAGWTHVGGEAFYVNSVVEYGNGPSEEIRVVEYESGDNIFP